GPVHVADAGTEVPAGSVLVVGHLDPRLATVIPRLAGLVAETGSPLSHLAILAREHGVATVVGLPDATSRFHQGDIVTVDGHGGSVTAVAPVPAPDGLASTPGVAA
ncbi:MAG: PEP-utilizing enzyme, partial [Ilumatobacteraceae bacterium]